MTELRVPVDEVRVNGRHRIDLGDVDSLAKSIADVGLINPITVTPDNLLIAGERRLAAVRSLGWTEVPARVVDTLTDAADRLAAERDENTCRLNMSPEELVRLGSAMEELARSSAADRMAEGQVNGGLARHGLLSSNVSRSADTQSRKAAETAAIVGDAIGLSRDRYYMARRIIRYAEDESQPDRVREAAAAARVEMNSTGLVTVAHEKLKAALGRERAAREAQEAKAAALADPVPEFGDDGLWVPELGDTSPNAAAQRRHLINVYAEQGFRSGQIADKIGLSERHVRKVARNHGIDIIADRTVGRTRRLDADRIVRETVHTLEGVAMGVRLIDYDDLDRAQIGDWAKSLADSIRVLNRLTKRLKEIAQ